MVRKSFSSLRGAPLLGLLTLGLFASIAAADLVPGPPAQALKKCKGTQCLNDTTTANDYCSGGYATVACCCRPNAGAAWGCSCILPTDCTNQGSRRCDQATA